MTKLKSPIRKAQVFDADKFGKVLKLKRTIQNDFTVREVADIVGLPSSTISRIERGLPTEMATILLVSDWIGQSVCDFIVYERVPAFPVLIK